MQKIPHHGLIIYHDVRFLLCRRHNFIKNYIMLAERKYEPAKNDTALIAAGANIAAKPFPNIFVRTLKIFAKSVYGIPNMKISPISVYNGADDQ